MCEALRRLMKDDFDELESAVLVKNIKNVMESFHVTAEQAMDALKISSKDRATYLSKL